MEMDETKVRNRKVWYFAWALIIVGALMAGLQASQPKGPQISWRAVPMDGHRIQAQSVTLENVSTALGTWEDSVYVAPSGARYPADSPVAAVARTLQAAQPKLSHLKVVIGHSDGMYMNLRNQPDLPLGNLVADALRAWGSNHFGVPMDFAVTNYGGIRVPLPEGAVTLEDIVSMFPFKNYMCRVSMKGSSLQKLLEQLAATPAFQAVSGCRVEVKDGQLLSVTVGGKPIEPDRLYNVITVDFLLDGGDQINIGALAEEVELTHVLIQTVMLDEVKSVEAAGGVLHPASDGRVVYLND